MKEKRNEKYESYVKNLEEGYLKIYEIFATHAYNDISMIHKIYEIVKPIKERIWGKPMTNKYIKDYSKNCDIEPPAMRIISKFIKLYANAQNVRTILIKNR